jgi:CheY-like chemotaxis protein
MGGSISVQSKQNIGSTFTVTLSFEKTNIVEDDRLQSHSEQSRDLRNRRILIVEDNSLNQMVLKHILASWHATFEVAENGTEAIALLADHDFDIVLMDLQMPEMSGYEATQFIRNKNTPVRNPLIPIIAITADAFPETRRRVLETGMNDFVSKPFEKDELYNKIMRLCK